MLDSRQKYWSVFSKAQVNVPQPKDIFFTVHSGVKKPEFS